MFPLRKSMSPMGRFEQYQSNWWLSGGVASSQCVAAYQPKGAASLAASYVNLNSPGTYDAAPGVPPGFSSATGWNFIPTQRLATGIIPTQLTWSTIIGFSDVTTSNNTLIGALNVPTLTGFLIYIAPPQTYFTSGTFPNTPATLSPTSGTLAIAGLKGYYNGIDQGITNSAGGALGLPIFINSYEDSAKGLTVKVQAVAIYNIALSAAQVLAIHTAMQAL